MQVKNGKKYKSLKKLHSQGRKEGTCRISNSKAWYEVVIIVKI
jgi:hypothetical protein